MSGPARITISEVVDGSRISGFQIGIFVLCTLAVFMDGFDVQALGYIAPAVVRDFKVPSSALGPVFGAANFGFLIGSLLLSMAADKVGRRPVLIGATIFFAVVTLVTPSARSIGQLLLLRFVAGIGLGSIIPQAAALVSEYSPQSKRVTAVMMMTTLGFNVGATVGGLLSAWVVPSFGWAAVFYVGGVMPLVVAVLMFVWLPESPQFLVLRQKGLDRVAAWMSRISPSRAGGSGVEYVVNEEHHRGVPVLHLFREGRTMVTILLWIVNFMNLLLLYSLSSWLPTVVGHAGYSIATSARVGALLQVGGVIGTFFLAWFISRLGFMPVLATAMAVACAVVAAIGQPGLSFPVLLAVVFVAGWCVIGSQPGINALAATSYPTYLRSTGVGWGLGIGRVGAIVGPVIGGQLMIMQWSTERLFLAAALPAVVSMLTLVSMGWAIEPQ